ncbi:MAG: diguanylate cyclase [Candidatus Brocadiaceae bacterium]|nr:diguanylate cyclase [Candidatus Brocadiaceae bacterium]
MFQKRSVRNKFILFTSLLTILPVGILAGFKTNFSRQRLSTIEQTNTNPMNTATKNEWEEKAHSQVHLSAREITRPTNELDDSEINYLPNLNMEGKGFRYVSARNDKGQALGDSSEGFGLQRNISTGEPAHYAPGSEELTRQRQNDAVDVVAPILDGSKVPGVVTIGFSLNETKTTPDALHNGKTNNLIKQSATIFKQHTILFLPAIMIPVMVIGWIFIRGLSLPIQRLVMEMEKIAKGGFRRRVEINSEDGAGKIGQSFNEMTTDLQRVIISKEYANAIIKSMDVSIVLTSPDFTIRMVNRATCELLGYLEKDLIGKSLAVLFSDEDVFIMSLLDLIKNNLVHKIEKTFLSKDGRKIPVLFSGTEIRQNNDDLLGIVCVAHDITERKQIEAELKRAVAQRDMNIKDLGYLMYFSTLMNEEVREEILIHHMANALQVHFQPELLAVLTIDKTKNVFDAALITPPMPLNKLIRDEVIVDPSLCQVIRTGREIIIDNNAKDILCECTIYKIEEGGFACLPLITGGTISGMVIIGKKDKEYWYNEDVRKLTLVYVGLTASALQRVRLIDLTRRAAITDSLTGAYNRRFFDEMLKKQIALAKRRSESLGLVIADLDHFKNINDTYGHMTGDRALQQIASMMKNSIRSSDVLARYGGEEFIIIMPSIDITNTLKKAESLRQQVESFQFQIDPVGRSPQITISIGVASFPDHGIDYDSLISAADLALYKAKKNGRNRVETV